MQKIYSTLILYVLIFLIGTNVTELIGEGGATAPYRTYMQNDTIRNFYYLAILIDVLLIGSIVLTFFKINTRTIFVLRLFVLILCLSAFALVLYEMYFGSTFYYGEVRDKQFPSGVNNLGFLSTPFLLSYSIVQFVLPVLHSRRQKIFYIALVTILIIIAHILLFKFLQSPWRMDIS